MKSIRPHLMALRSDPLFRNSFYLFLSTITMAGFGFIFWLLVAHYYSPSEVGVASTLISAMSFMSYVALLGFNTTFIRFLPKSKKRSEEIDTGLILVFLASLLVAGLYALIVPIISPKLQILHDHWYYTVAFVVLVAGSAINLVTDSIFIAYRSSAYNLIVDGIVSSLIQVALPVALVSLGAFGIFASAGAAVTTAMLLSIFLLIKKFKYVPKLRIHKQTLREVFKFSFTSYLSNLLNILPILLLPLIIITKLGEESAGYYYLAFMMANLLYSISYALNQSVLAEGSYAQTSLIVLAKKSATALAIIMIPASAALALLGPTVLKLFGQNYSAHGEALLHILALAGPFVATYIFAISMLRILKRSREIIMVNLFYVVSVVSFAYLWAPHGLVWVGAAWLVGNLATALFALSLLFFSDAPASLPS